MNKILKRSVSSLLALVMLIGFLPTFSVAEAAIGDSVTYDFTSSK